MENGVAASSVITWHSRQAQAIGREHEVLGSRPTFRNDDHFRRLDQRWILAAVHETGQIAVVPVRPARHPPGNRCEAFQIRDDPVRGVEQHVAGTAGQTYDGIVLRRRQLEKFLI